MNQKKLIYIAMAALFFVFLSFSAPSAAFAEANVTDWLNDKEPETEQPVESIEAKPAEDQSLLPIIGKLILYTLLILVMIYGLIKFLALRQKKMQPNQAVTMMGGTPLGNNKSLQLIKVGGKVYMIGVGDDVSLLKEFTAEDEISSIEKDLEKQPTIFSNPKFKVPANLFGALSKDSSKEANPGGFEQLFTQSLTKQKHKQDQLKNDLIPPDDEEGNSK